MSQVNNVSVATGAATSNNEINKLYLYDLPTNCKQELYKHLDSLNVWQDLAKVMQLYDEDIQEINKEQSAGRSPTEKLLNIWGKKYYHTVEEFFWAFRVLKLYSAMRLLEPFVDAKYHKYILDSIANSPVQTTVKILNVAEQNNSDNNNTTDNNITESATKTDGDYKMTSTYLPPERILATCSMEEIDYAELTQATNNWSKENELGRGGFGTVYRGNWRFTPVAIKQIHYSGSSDHESVRVQLQQSLNELKHLNSCRHDNVLPLYGYCLSGEKPCLVYQLCKGGTLHDRLYRTNLPTLTWQERMDICYNTARGINSLHERTKPLIHGDIKPANILLDERLQPKIGDFGLAREGPSAINIAVKISQCVGTLYYLPPEYLRLKKLSTKVDIYSYGLVVLETFTGMRIHDKKRTNESLSEHIREISKHAPIRSLIDNRLPLTNNREEEMCIKTIQIAMKCISVKADERPEMKQILNELSCYVEL